LSVFPLASRVELSEPTLRDAWRHGSKNKGIAGYQPTFENLFDEIYALTDAGCNLQSYFDKILIQYIPRYSYGEDIAVQVETTSDRLSLSQSYEFFAEQLATRSVPWWEPDDFEVSEKISNPQMGICRVIAPNGDIVGTAFLISDQLVLTCAHIVEAAKSGPGQVISLKFVNSEEKFTARVDAQFWRSSENGDVAFLRLEKNPENIVPLRLGAAKQSLSGNMIQVFGYQRMGAIDGIHARGEILGMVMENDQPLLQLRSKEFMQGYSGAPVWDEKRGVVVGMVVSVYKSDASGKMRDTAFAIPSETLWQVCTEIQSSEIPPYIGLQNFTVETSRFFFGREALTEKLLGVLRGGCRFIAVFGPSGSGKSSVVRAGLLPVLEKGQLPGSEKWTQITIRPTDNPFEQMKAAGLDSFDVKKYLDLHEGVERIVLFVDQFEEMFTLCPDELRKRFVSDLAGALENSRLILILSMRDEFYSAFNAKAAPLAESDHLKIENVPGTLRWNELMAMIKQPAEAVGLTIEDGLPEQIVKDVLTSGGEARSSSLPLLEFALTQLWERRRDGLLTHDAYQSIGGVTGSLGRWADDAYSDLPKEDRTLAENLLTSLVHLGDESQGLPDTRRRRNLSDLANSESAQRVITHFANCRLIVTSNDVVELIHDAILYEWNQFSDWLNENRAFLTWQQKTSERCREWVDGRGELLRGRELAMAQEFWAKRRIDLEVSDLEKLGNYISSSVKQVQRIRFLVTSSIVLAFMLLAGIGISAWGQRNKAVNSQATVIAGMATQTVAVANEKNAQATTAALIGIPGVSKRIAEAESIYKLSEKLSAQALSVVNTNYSQGLLLGVESFRMLEENELAQGKTPDTLPQLLEKVPAGLMRTQMYPPSGVVRKVVFSPSGNLMVTLSDTIDVWDLTDPLSPVLVTTWNSSLDIKATDVTFSSNGTSIVLGYADGHVELWAIVGADITKEFTFEVFTTTASADVKVAVSKDTSLLAVGGDGTILIYDISDIADQPEEIGHISHPHEGKEVEYLWFDPNYQNSFLVSGGGDGSFHVWDLRKEYTPTKPYRSIPRHHGIADLAISSEYVITAGEDSLYINRSFNKAFTPIMTIAYSDYHNGSVRAMMINSSSTRLYTTGQDGAIVEWDITDPYRVKFVKAYSGHTSRVSSAAFHPSGKFIVSGSDDSKLVSWNIDSEPIPIIWRSRIWTTSPITDIAYAPNKNLLAVGEESGLVVLWDITNPSSPSVRYRHFIRVPIAHVAFSPDEAAFMFISAPTNAYSPTGYLMQDLEYFLDPRKIFELNTADILAGTGSYVLAGEIGDSTLKVFQWNVVGKVTREHDPMLIDACPFRDYAYAGDDTLVAIATCKLQLWKFPFDGPPSMIREFGSANPVGVDLSEDGALLASANADNTFSLWRIPANGEPQSLVTKNSEHLTPITGVTFDSKQQVMASGGDDPSIVYWNITDPANPVQRFVLNGHTSKVLNGGVFFSSDDNTLISASRDEVILWDVNPDSWIEKACRVAGRNFTQQEWNQNVGEEIPYHLTCKKFPAMDK